MKDSSIVDVLIENIKTDQKLLELAETKIEEAKDEKKSIIDRIKSYRKDISTFLKYVDDTQRKQIEELGFDFDKSDRGLNATAQNAYDILLKVRGNKMSNEELYNTYQASFKNKDDAYGYTDFNINCRSLFNTQRLIRTKSKDSKSSKADVISINGNLLQPQTKK